MTAASRRKRDERAAEYVDSPLMHMRIRDGNRLVVRIDGHFGSYLTDVDLTDADRDACTCPSEQWPCKHVRALRKTWRIRRRSFLDLNTLLDGLSRQGGPALVNAIRTIAMAYPESLGALGVPGFSGHDGEDEGEDDPDAEVISQSVPASMSPATPRFTALQGQYLAFIHTYATVHGRAPAEADLQQYFRVSPPSVHRMILALEQRGLLRRQPGQARSVRVLLRSVEIPDLAPAPPP